MNQNEFDKKNKIFSRKHAQTMSYSVLNENYRLKVENSSNVVPDAQ